MKKLKKTLLSITLILTISTFGLNVFAGEAEDPIGLGCVSPIIHILHISNI